MDPVRSDHATEDVYSVYVNHEEIPAAEAAEFRVHIEKLHLYTFQVNRYWYFLRCCVKLLYDDIWNKWKALGESERREVLQDAAILHGRMDLAKHHRPDIEGIEKPPGYEDVETFATQACFMWPYLTEEDLAFGDTFLTYIYHRGQRHYDDYRHADLQSTRGGRGKPNFTPFLSSEGAVVKPAMAKKIMVGFKPFSQDAVAFVKENAKDRPIEFFFTMFVDRIQRGPLGPHALGKFSFEDALRISMVQSRVYGYLCAVCTILMQDSLKDHEFENGVKEPSEFLPECRKIRNEAFSKGLSNYTSQCDLTPPEERHDRFLRDDMVPVLADLRIQAAYGPPGNIQWDSLDELIEMNVSNARATLHQLRDDPGIFEDALRQERVDLHPSRWVTLGPSKGEFANEEFGTWRDALKSRITNAVKDYERWADLYDAFSKLRNTHAEVEHQLGPAAHDVDYWSAAQRLNGALYAFHYRAEQYSELVVKDLEDFVSRSWFFRDYIQRNRSGKLVLKDTLGIAEEAGRKEIYRKLLKLLTNDRVQFGLSGLLDNLERALQSGKDDDAENTKTNYLPPRVQSILGDLGVFAECLNQVESWQPWATLLLSDWNWGKMGPLRDEVEEREKVLSDLSGSNRPWSVLCKVALPRPGTFDYPTHEERTAEVVRQIRSAEDLLDKFWQKFMEELGPGPRNQNAFPEKTLELLSETPWRMPAWETLEDEENGEIKETMKEELQEEGEEQEEDQEEETDIPMTATPPAAAETESSGPKTPSPKRPRDDDEPPEQSPPKKQKGAKANKQRGGKQKTGKQKGKQKPGKQGAGKQGAGKHVGKQPGKDSPEPVIAKIKVSEDTLESLGYLFHVPEKKGGGGQLSWRNFRRMMGDIGFAQLSSSGGSATLWKPTDPAFLATVPKMKRGQTRIDKPHPENKIPPKWARQWGQKLRSTYMWDINSFELRS
ncbi:hypothetical protein NKR19_g6351 [Coniochaeta hoffmannii]|uniref:Uncharacterized protein n=1 Tax=Coniochaeta hoffmannii TaxID=91930 RepID=A0AA38RRR5_9PEZI|nr:hypothetical protein NKR19_g6351 [Coniochaeta hoffmannii]